MSLTLRITSVVGYINCPAQFFFKEIRRVERPLAYPILLGSAGHKPLEAHNRHLMEHGSLPPFSLLQSILDAAAKENKVARKDALRLRVLLHQYYLRYGRSFTPEHVEERRFIDFDSGCLVTGKSDLVTADEIVDYKFSRVCRSRADVADDLQLGFYATMFEKPLARIVRLNPSGTVSTVGAPALSKQEVMDRIGAVVTGIRAGRYPSNRAFKWCSKRLCAFWSSCRGNRK